MPFTPPGTSASSLWRAAVHRIQVITPAAVAMLVLTTAAASARVVGVATVEAVPAEPHDAGPDGDQKVVRQSVLGLSANGGRRPGGNKAGDTGRHVDDEAAGEVGSTFLGEVTAAPEHEASTP